MEAKLDLRVKKTRQALVQALQELLQEKTFEEISVSALCHRAEIRRATFYKHFKDKYDLLAYMIRDLQQAYNAKFETTVDIKNLFSYLAQVFGYYLDFLDENRNMARMIAGSRERNMVFDMLNESLIRDLSAHFQTLQQSETKDRAALEMLAVLYSGAMVNCGRWWLTRGSRLSKAQVVEKFKQLIERL